MTAAVIINVLFAIGVVLAMVTHLGLAIVRDRDHAEWLARRHWARHARARQARGPRQ